MSETAARIEILEDALRSNADLMDLLAELFRVSGAQMEFFERIATQVEMIARYNRMMASGGHHEIGGTRQVPMSRN
jgi:hypothetical protein